MPGILSSSIDLMDPMLRGLQHESPETSHINGGLATNQNYFQWYSVATRLILLEFTQWKSSQVSDIYNREHFLIGKKVLRSQCHPLLVLLLSLSNFSDIFRLLVTDYKFPCRYFSGLYMSLVTFTPWKASMMAKFHQNQRRGFK